MKKKKKEYVVREKVLLIDALLMIVALCDFTLFEFIIIIYR